MRSYSPILSALTVGVLTVGTDCGYYDVQCCVGIMGVVMRWYRRLHMKMHSNTFQAVNATRTLKISARTTTCRLRNIPLRFLIRQLAHSQTVRTPTHYKRIQRTALGGTRAGATMRRGRRARGAHVALAGACGARGHTAHCTTPRTSAASAERPANAHGRHHGQGRQSRSAAAAVAATSVAALADVHAQVSKPELSHCTRSNERHEHNEWKCWEKCGGVRGCCAYNNLSDHGST